jgi:hypothetical protein
MPHLKVGCRLGQGCPAGLAIAKSAEAENAGAVQQSAKHRWQSARSVSWSRGPVSAGLQADEDGASRGSG